MVDAPYQIFVDADATALDGGYVRVGAAYGNPLTNPIPLYWDSELTVPAAQPLRTLGGLIAREGTPADVYCASATYSVDVANSDDEHLWYAASVGGTTPASRMTFPIASGPQGEKGDKGDTGAPGTAAATSKLTFARTSVAQGASGGDVVAESVSAGPQGNGAGGSDVSTWRIVFETNYQTNGPVGQPTYYDNAAFIGWNATAGLSRLDPTRPMTGWTFENKFYQDGVFASEVQLRHYDIGNTGFAASERRPIQFFLPHQFVRGKARCDLQADIFNLNDWANVQIASWDLQGHVGNFAVPWQWRYVGNNTPNAQQINAAGDAFLPLPYINGRNEIQTAARYTYQFETAPVNIHGKRSMDTVYAQELGPGGRLRDSSVANPISGDAEADDIRANVAGKWILRLTNNGAGPALFDAAGATGTGFSVNGQRVVGAQQPAIANATMASNSAAAPTQAEFNALVAKYNDLATLFNALLAGDRAWGKLAT